MKDSWKMEESGCDSVRIPITTIRAIHENKVAIELTGSSTFLYMNLGDAH